MGALHPVSAPGVQSRKWGLVFLAALLGLIVGCMIAGFTYPRDGGVNYVPGPSNVPTENKCSEICRDPVCDPIKPVVHYAIFGAAGSAIAAVVYIIFMLITMTRSTIRADKVQEMGAVHTTLATQARIANQLAGERVASVQPMEYRPSDFGM